VRSAPSRRRSSSSSRVGLPAGSPPRFLTSEQLPRGGALWDPTATAWSEANTDGLWLCDFVEAAIRLTKGERRGELVQLRHWQGDLICDVLRLNRQGRRMYRVYEVFIARKNSKTLLGAGFALDGLLDEPGAEVYSCAGDRDQAKLVFREVKQAVEMSPELSRLFTTYRDAIEYPAQGSVYKAVSSDAALKEGLSPSRVIFDEKHVQPSDDLWNVMNQGSGTRARPLVLTLTTKGVRTYSDGTDTVCFRGYKYARRVASGEVKDLTYGSRIYETTDADADHQDERTWFEANPALGDFLHIEDMRSVVKKIPEADFRAKRMNIWVSSAKTWLPGGAFERLRAPRRRPVPGEPALLCFDGSFNNDCTAVVAWLLGGRKPHLTLLQLWERPEEAGPEWHVPVAEVERLLVDTYRGALLSEHGDPGGERADPRWQVLGIAFDPSKWLRTMQVLDEAGLPIIAVPNSAERMVPATQAFYEATMSGAYTHDGAPALVRHFRNAVTRLTNRGVQIYKAGAKAKIDAAVASVFGWPLAIDPPAQRDIADSVW